MNDKWLNIGCGKQHLDGFVNMDIGKPYDKKLDARKGFPITDRSVDGIYSEHFFEHLTQGEGVSFLRECRRVLKPKGRVRIAMPDLDDLVRRYCSEDWRGDGDMFKMGCDWVVNRCEMLNIAMRDWGHKHVYNEEELVRIARLAGLEPVKRFALGESDIPEFRDRETRNSSKLIMEFTLPEVLQGKEPLVSILIPAYRSTWFKQALESAIHQTYKNMEIVVCDDSPNREIEDITTAAAKEDGRIKYIRNEEKQGSLGNHLKCFSISDGELIKFLNDDDLLAPDCVQRMIAIFNERPGITLVTSRRKRIDENGSDLPDIDATHPISASDVELEGASCAAALISLRTNFVGEPTTAMFRRSDLAWVEPHVMSFGGTMGVGAGDVSMWLNLLGRGNAYYIAETLSYFRIHPDQRQNDPKIIKEGPFTWQHWFVFHGHRLGFKPKRFVMSMKGRRSSYDPWRALPITHIKSLRRQMKEKLKVKARLKLLFKKLAMKLSVA